MKNGTVKHNTIKWDAGVKRGLQMVASQEDIQWELGELADQIEPKYGDQTLAKFAEAIGIDAKTLANHRVVYRAFPEKSLRRENSYSVCKVFASQDDREALAKQKRWTKHDAEELIKKRHNKPTSKAQSKPASATEQKQATAAQAQAAKAKAEAATAKATAAKAKAEAAAAKAKAAKAKADVNKARAEAHAEMFSRWSGKKKEIHSSDRTLLIKALGMLGSEQAGERDNAAMMAEKLRKKLDMSWDQLIVEAAS